MPELSRRSSLFMSLILRGYYSPTHTYMRRWATDSHFYASNASFCAATGLHDVSESCSVYHVEWILADTHICPPRATDSSFYANPASFGAATGGPSRLHYVYESGSVLSCGVTFIPHTHLPTGGNLLRFPCEPCIFWCGDRRTFAPLLSRSGFTYGVGGHHPVTGCFCDACEEGGS